MIELSKGRELIQSAKFDIGIIKQLIEFCKGLMTVLRFKWTPPSENIYFIKPTQWIEELLLVAYKISDLFLENEKLFHDQKLCAPFAAILEFATVESRQEEIAVSIIDRLAQNLVNPNLLIPFYSITKSLTPISLFISTYQNEIKESTLMVAILALASQASYTSQIEPILPSLETSYPTQVSSLKALLTLRKKTISHYDEVLPSIISQLKECPDQDSAIMEYNIAYLYALSGDRDNAFSYCKAAIRHNRNNADIILLLIRLLHAKGDLEKALSIAKNSRRLFDVRDKRIYIEGMHIAMEIDDKHNTDIDLFQGKLLRHWKEDPIVLEAVVEANLLLGRLQVATDLFKAWSERDNETPEFFYCYSQICLYSKDLMEAKRYLRYASQLDPSSSDYHAALAMALYNIDRKDNAKDEAIISTTLNPKCVHGWMALGSILTGPESDAAIKKAKELLATQVNLKYLTLQLCPCL